MHKFKSGDLRPHDKTFFRGCKVFQDQSRHFLGMAGDTEAYRGT